MKRLLFLLLLLPVFTQGQIINTIAGNGARGYSRDGGLLPRCRFTAINVHLRRKRTYPKITKQNNNIDFQTFSC